MKSFTKVIVGLGIVSCAGISLMPLGASFADSTPSNVASKDVNVNLLPVHALSVDANSKSFSVTPGSTTPATATTTLTCASNSSTGYDVTVNSVNADTDASHTTAASRISKLTSGNNYIPSSTTFVSGDVAQSAYAIRTAISPNTDQVIPASNGTALKVATKGSTSVSGGDSYSIGWRISAAANQPSGVYTDQVTFTIATISS